MHLSLQPVSWLPKAVPEVRFVVNVFFFNGALSLAFSLTKRPFMWDDLQFFLGLATPSLLAP